MPEDPWYRVDRRLLPAALQPVLDPGGESIRASNARRMGRPYGAAAVPLLILTGCRNREILNLRWGQVDLEAGDPRLADTTTGPRRVALSPWAVRVPKSIPRLPNSLWVISGMVDTAGVCRRVPTVLHRSRTVSGWHTRVARCKYSRPH